MNVFLKITPLRLLILLFPKFQDVETICPNFVDSVSLQFLEQQLLEN